MRPVTLFLYATAYAVVLICAPPAAVVVLRVGRLRHDGCSSGCAHLRLGRFEALQAVQLEDVAANTLPSCLVYRGVGHCRSPFLSGCEEMLAHSTLFKNLHSMTRERASRAYEAMARTIVEEDLPFIVCDRPCMRELFAIVNPTFVVPCSRTLVETYIPGVCASIEHAMKEELGRTRHLTLTADGWKEDLMHLNAVVVCTPAPIFIGVYRASDRAERMDPYRPLRRSMKVETLNKQLFGKWNAFLVPGYDDLDDEHAPKRPRRSRMAMAASTAAQTEDAGAPTQLQPAPFPDLIDAANDVRRELESQFELGDSESTADDAGEGGARQRGRTSC